MAESEWMTTREAAEELGVHRSTLLRLLDHYRFPVLRLRSEIRIHREDWHKFLQLRKEPYRKGGSKA